jgi:hypothetical protein
LSPSQEDAVKKCIEKLNLLLQCATKKRPDGVPSFLGSQLTAGQVKTSKEKLATFLAETLSKQLVIRGMKDINDWELHKIVYAIAEKSELNADGCLLPPSAYPPAPSPPPPQYNYYNQGYSTGNPTM